MAIPRRKNSAFVEKVKETTKPGTPYDISAFCVGMSSGAVGGPDHCRRCSGPNQIPCYNQKILARAPTPDGTPLPRRKKTGSTGGEKKNFIILELIFFSPPCCGRRRSGRASAGYGTPRPPPSASACFSARRCVTVFAAQPRKNSALKENFFLFGQGRQKTAPPRAASQGRITEGVPQKKKIKPLELIKALESADGFEFFTSDHTNV